MLSTTFNDTNYGDKYAAGYLVIESKLVPFLLSIALVLLITSQWAFASSDFVLITEEEYARSLAIEQPDKPEYQFKSVLGAPKIVLVSPEAQAKPIASPVDIEVQFTAGNDASIDISTLKIFYIMLFKKDVTKRLMEHAQVGDTFIRANGAILPSGEHSFILQIKDTLGRAGQSKFNINVTSQPIVYSWINV